jgi:hypothetical protein
LLESARVHDLACVGQSPDLPFCLTDVVALPFGVSRESGLGPFRRTRPTIAGDEIEDVGAELSGVVVPMTVHLPIRPGKAMLSGLAPSPDSLVCLVQVGIGSQVRSRRHQTRWGCGERDFARTDSVDADLHAHFEVDPVVEVYGYVVSSLEAKLGLTDKIPNHAARLGNHLGQLL